MSLKRTARITLKMSILEYYRTRPCARTFVFVRSFWLKLVLCSVSFSLGYHFPARSCFDAANQYTMK